MLTQNQVDKFNKYFVFSVELTALQEIKPEANAKFHDFEACEVNLLDRHDKETCVLETKNNKNGYAGRVFNDVPNPEQLLMDIVSLLSHVNDEGQAYEVLNDENSILNRLTY